MTNTELALETLKEADLDNKASMKIAIRYAVQLLESASKEETKIPDKNILYDDENPDYILGTKDGI